VNKNLPQSPPGTGGLQPGLFDQIEAQGAPLSLAPSAPRTPPGIGDGFAGTPASTGSGSATITPNVQTSPFDGRALKPGSSMLTRGPLDAPTSGIGFAPTAEGRLQINHAQSNVPGEGKLNMMDLAQHATDNQMPLDSDVTLSSSAAGVYKSLQKAGKLDFDHQSPATEKAFNAATGNKIISGNGRPVLTNIRLPAPGIGDQVAGP
jgi:hypothetical protein